MKTDLTKQGAVRETKTMAGFTKKLQEICDKYDKKMFDSLNSKDADPTDSLLRFEIDDMTTDYVSFYLNFESFIKTEDLKDLIEDVEVTLGAEGTYSCGQSGPKFHFMCYYDEI